MTASHRSAEDPSDPGRRRALKIGLAVGAGGLVWTEPTIKGLARRPAYADALSSPVAFSWAGSMGEVLVTTIAAGIPNVTFAFSEGLGQTMMTATFDDGVTQCACTFDEIAASVLTLLPESGSAESLSNLAGSAGASALTFDGVFGIAPGGFPYDPALYVLTGAAGFSGSCG